MFDKENLPTHLASNFAHPDSLIAENLMSSLLMGYVERRISPHTIADIMRTQIFENQATPESFSYATCNGVIELLVTPQSGSCLDILQFFVSHSKFPEFLSYKAALGIVNLLINNAYIYGQKKSIERTFFTTTLNNVIKRLDFFLTNTNDHNYKLTILSTLNKLNTPQLQWISEEVTQINILKEKITKSKSVTSTTIKNLTSAGDIYADIINSPDHILAQKGVGSFKIHFLDNNSFWKLKNIHLLFSSLACSTLTDYKIGFIVEWFLTNSLLETHDKFSESEIFVSSILKLLDEHGTRVPVLKGLIRALQNDLSKCALESEAKILDNIKFNDLLQKAEKIFIHLTSSLKKDENNSIKNFLTSLLREDIYPIDSRLVTRQNVLWMKALAFLQWDEGLKEPPQWIIANSSSYSAVIFQIAPNYWLQTFASKLIERLYVESINPSFIINKSHYDYVEYLIKTLRKKSPYFALRHELLFALRILNKASSNELSQIQIIETRFRMGDLQNLEQNASDKVLWQKILNQEFCAPKNKVNAITRALYILMHSTTTLSPLKN